MPVWFSKRTTHSCTERCRGWSIKIWDTIRCWWSCRHRVRIIITNACLLYTIPKVPSNERIQSEFPSCHKLRSGSILFWPCIFHLPHKFGVAGKRGTQVHPCPIVLSGCAYEDRCSTCIVFRTYCWEVRVSINTFFTTDFPLRFPVSTRLPLQG